MDRLLELTARAERSHFWFRGFRWFMRPEVARALSGRRAPLLLDCGCGTGANLAWLREFGTAYGFDLTWNGLALGRAMGRSGMARASIGAIPFATGRFDLATSFDVFQCLPEEVEAMALAEMFRVLRPGGHLLLNVAALEVLRGAHSALSEEVRRYTPARLRRVVEDAGFAIERLTFVNASLFPMMLPVRIAQRWASGGTAMAGEFEITVPAAPVNGALTALVGLEAAALRVVDMPIGGSLLCHAIKRA
jgi:SAM-dependent methyltransferase